MINGKLKSSYEVIDRVLRDGDYRDVDFNLSNLIEWTAECLDLIGCPASLVDTIDCIEIKDHRGMLPCNLHTIKQVTGLTITGGYQFPMRYANNTFHPLFLNNLGQAGTINPQEPIAFDAQGNPIYNFYNYPADIPKNSVALPSYFNDATYTTNDNFIFTSFKDSANILIAYKAYPVDDNGFPLIPDNEKFRQAVQWYIMCKLDYKMWRGQKLSDKQFNYTETQRDWYIGAATTSGLTPTIDQMESWAQQTMHLLPRLHLHAENFDTLGSRELLTFGQKFLRY